jgi:hypothetical protein
VHNKTAAQMKHNGCATPRGSSLGRERSNCPRLLGHQTHGEHAARIWARSRPDPRRPLYRDSGCAVQRAGSRASAGLTVPGILVVVSCSVVRVVRWRPTAAGLSAAISRPPRRTNDISNHRKRKDGRKSLCGCRRRRCLRSAERFASALPSFSDEVCARQTQSFSHQLKNEEKWLLQLFVNNVRAKFGGRAPSRARTRLRTKNRHFLKTALRRPGLGPARAGGALRAPPRGGSKPQNAREGY